MCVPGMPFQGDIYSIGKKVIRAGTVLETKLLLKEQRIRKDVKAQHDLCLQPFLGLSNQEERALAW